MTFRFFSPMFFFPSGIGHYGYQWETDVSAIVNLNYNLVSKRVFIPLGVIL